MSSKKVRIKSAYKHNPDRVELLSEWVSGRLYPERDRESGEWYLERLVTTVETILVRLCERGLLTVAEVVDLVGTGAKDQQVEEESKCVHCSGSGIVGISSCSGDVWPCGCRYKG